MFPHLVDDNNFKTIMKNLKVNKNKNYNILKSHEQIQKKYWNEQIDRQKDRLNDYYRKAEDSEFVYDNSNHFSNMSYGDRKLSSLNELLNMQKRQVEKQDNLAKSINENMKIDLENNDKATEESLNSAIRTDSINDNNKLNLELDTNSVDVEGGCNQCQKNFKLNAGCDSCLKAGCDSCGKSNCKLNADKKYKYQTVKIDGKGMEINDDYVNIHNYPDREVEDLKEYKKYKDNETKRKELIKIDGSI